MRVSNDAWSWRRLRNTSACNVSARRDHTRQGSKTGRLWILKKGAVAVVRQGIEIAKVAEPGAVFGDLSALLDTPHTADVRALEISVFHVADAASSLQDPAVLVHVARVLAQRLNGASQALIELKTKPS